MSERKSFKLGFFFSLIFAFLVFNYLYGSAFLFPSQTDWMMRGDPSQHFFGLNFFLSEPWHWPFGLIENFNWPFHTSVVYTDSIPLIAIPLKLFAKGQILQFHGLWVLLCFLLQGIAGYLFIFRAAKKASLAVAGSILITLFPSFLFRGFDPSRHYSCLAHFLILPAIVLAIDAFQKKTSPEQRFKCWCLLFLLTLGIHFYFFYLNVLIFLVTERNLFRSKNGIVKLAVLGTVLLGTLSALGYFVIPVARSFEGGFASYSMNLLSWWNGEGYSVTHLQFPEVSGDQREGFQYLGLGTIFLIMATLAQKTNLLQLRKQWARLLKTPYFLLLAFFFFFALSIRVSIAQFALPDFLTAPLYWVLFCVLFRKLDCGWKKSAILSTLLLTGFIFSGHLLRSSGRAGWYVSYFLIFILFSLKPKPWLVATAILLQCVDVAPILASIRAENQSLLSDHRTREISQSFEASGLGDFLGRRPALTLLSLSVNDQAPVAEYALIHHLKLGPVYVARGQIKTNHSWTEDEKDKIRLADLSMDEVIVTSEPNSLSRLEIPSELATLQIGNYLWIKRAEKN